MTARIIRLDDPAVQVRLTRHARARRFTLSVRDGEARLTAPDGAPEGEARRFLDRQRGWLRDAMLRAPSPVAVGPGVVLPLAGRPVTVRPSGLARGACRLEGDSLLAPEAAPGAAVAAFLRALAQDRLAPAARAAAHRLGRRAGRIAFRDTRSRWGSCTSRGDLAFSWRLAMAPPAVQDYVAAHEAAHLVEMNHSPAFWALVSRLCPDYRVQRAWLRSEGRGLHGYAFR